KKERCEFCYSRAFRTVYYNILNKIPSVLECHEAHIWKPKVKMILNMGRNDNFKGIITISEILKTWYINAGFPEEKILVIDDAIDLTKYDLVKMNKSHLRELLKLPKNKSIIMYTGSLFQGRGIDTIIDAADKFENKNVLFLIIGGKSGEIRYWSKYKESKRNDFNLKFTGFIQNSKIPLYHKAADILLAPYSLSCPTVEWMSPIKIFEYMGSKVPIIASNVNRIKEICQNGECMFFEENNPVDLAKKIDILLSDNNLKSNYVKKAYNTVKKHTYQKRCKKILNFFLFK
ncbi:MAG: glycosyltransferase, partial [Candidatus Lokiarchaeota archaeon]